MHYMQRWGEHTEDSHTLRALIAAAAATEHAVDQAHKKKKKRKRKKGEKWTQKVGLGLRRCSVVAGLIVARLQRCGALLVGLSAYVNKLVNHLNRAIKHHCFIG